ncbi:MAG: ribonuclease HIII [Oligosphaeraceae bacterium]
MPSPSATLVFSLTPQEIHLLGQRLAAKGIPFAQAPYAHWRAARGKTNVTAYLSGKTCFQGGEAEAWVRELLPEKAAGLPRQEEPSAPKASALETALKSDPEMFTPHAGIDESGKGDFFGPLVVACAYTDAGTAAQLLDAGVRDSKAVSSDRQILALEARIRELLPRRFALVAISPERLNQLHARMGNLNQILAWAHARALESLLETAPDCPRAISDQFGRGDLVRRHLMERGRKILLDEHPKAEADVAVAAASILARAAYIREISRLSQAAGLLLPKGCSEKVLSCAKEFLKLHPREELARFAKLFFKTSQSL